MILELRAKVDDLENRSRRNNLVVYGVEESHEEDSKKQKVNGDIFRKILGVEINSIERMHRIGQRNAERPRPVILKLCNYVDKTKVLSSCFKLKGTNIFISEDFSKNIRDTRTKLWRSTAEERKTGSKVSLHFDKLKVDGKLYVRDALRNCRTELSQSTASAQPEKSTSRFTRATARKRDNK